MFESMKNGKGAVLTKKPAPPMQSPFLELTKEDKPKRSRKKKEEPSVQESKVEVIDTINSYEETNQLLRNTIGQIDQLTFELKQEMDNIRSSRAMKGRYQYLGNYMESMGSMLSTKIQAIKELNTSIKSSNELDYKKQKDSNALANQNNDAIIQGVYNSFIANPNNQGMGRSILGPNNQQMTFSGSDGIRMIDSDMSTNDMGYQNFMGNLSPEMNRMIHDDDPNIIEVVVFDQATGRKSFDMYNQSTGEIVPNMPHLDNMFLEDTTIDVDQHIARNINLNKTWRVVVLNEGSNAFGGY